MSPRLLLLGGALLALPLGGCGFQPLYAGPSAPVASALAAIGVNAPDTRTGQLFREEFDDEVARSAGGAPRYRLDVAIEERRFGRGLRIDDTANRFELRLNVRYRLVNLSNGNVVTRGDEPVYVTYDVADQPYAGVAAHQDGQERAASEAAIRIRQNLSRFFAGRAGIGGPTPSR
jgi:LPS-assembly lipoprotein